jgi:hypothetical protein
MPADVLLERLRAADRATYDTLLKWRAALDTYTYRPTADGARKAIEAANAHQRALIAEAEVLNESSEATSRQKRALEDAIRRLGENPTQPPLPYGGLSTMLGAIPQQSTGAVRVPSRY